MSELDYKPNKNELEYIKEYIEAGVTRGVDLGVKNLIEKSKNRHNEIVDNRLHNTKLLLTNYRKFVNYIDNAIYTDTKKDIDEMNYKDIIDKVDNELYNNKQDNDIVFSILKSKKRTEIIIKHIKQMIEVYLKNANLSNDDIEKRIAEELNTYYIKGNKTPTLDEMSDIFFLTPKQIRRDLEKAINEVSILMFGFDGINLEYIY